MLCLNEPVLTPRGWCAYGDLCPGDFVFGLDGLPIRIVALSLISTDGPAYEIEFDDHSTIQASADHLWTVDRKTRKRIAGTGPQRLYRETVTITTQEIAGHDHRQDNRLAIPVNAPLDLPDVALPIDPYVLGVWLGDGSRYGASVTMMEEDAEPLLNVLEYAGHTWKVSGKAGTDALTIRIDGRGSGICLRGHARTPENLYRGRHCLKCKRQQSRHVHFGDEMDPIVRDPLGLRLIRLNLISDQTGENREVRKNIPPMYLRASIEQRMELLRGLMDTDGHCNTRGTATFVNKHEPLVDAVCELATGLGLKPSVYRFEPDHGTYWQVAFQAYQKFNPFFIGRKAERAKVGERPNARRYIIGCRPIEPVPMRCIQVERADGQYLAGRRLVTTHNSPIGTFAGIIE